MAINIPEIKAGSKTTEFLLTILATIGLFYGMYVGFVPNELGLTLITALLGLYGIERAMVKKEQIKTESR